MPSFSFIIWKNFVHFIININTFCIYFLHIPPCICKKNLIQNHLWKLKMSITLFEATVRLDSALRAKAFVPILFSYLLYWGDAKKIRIQSPLSSLISTKNISFNKTIFFSFFEWSFFLMCSQDLCRLYMFIRRGKRTSEIWQTFRLSDNPFQSQKSGMVRGVKDIMHRGSQAIYRKLLCNLNILGPKLWRDFSTEFYLKWGILTSSKVWYPGCKLSGNIFGIDFNKLLARLS